MILVQQFTWIGAPHVWNGDEMGMWGADDPDSRKPIVWPDLTYEDEVADPFGRVRRRDPVVPDPTLRRVYADLIALRKAHLGLFVDGSVRTLLADDDRRLLAYERVLGGSGAVVVFNASDHAATATLRVLAGRYREAYPAGGTRDVVDGSLALELAPLSAQVWISDTGDAGRGGQPSGGQPSGGEPSGGQPSGGEPRVRR
jgi:glycosidase